MQATVKVLVGLGFQFSTRSCGFDQNHYYRKMLIDHLLPSKRCLISPKFILQQDHEEQKNPGKDGIGLTEP